MLYQMPTLASFSLWILDGSFAEVCHFGVLDLLLVQFILSPQQQLQELGQLGGRLSVLVVQHRLIHFTPHLRENKGEETGSPSVETSPPKL